MSNWQDDLLLLPAIPKRKYYKEGLQNHDPSQQQTDVFRSCRKKTSFVILYPLFQFLIHFRLSIQSLLQQYIEYNLALPLLLCLTMNQNSDDVVRLHFPSDLQYEFQHHISVSQKCCARLCMQWLLNYSKSTTSISMYYRPKLICFEGN